MRVAVVPARNEETNLARLVNNLKHRVDVILVVDDGSIDATGEIASGLGCVVLRNEYRAGYGATLRRGLHWCCKGGASVAITIDADGQHEAEWIDEGIPFLEAGADVVFANRFAAFESVPETKRLSNNFAWHCVKQCIQQSPVCEDVSCGFRIYNQRGLLAALGTPVTATSGYAFTHATCVELHRTRLHLAAFNTRAIYVEPVIGTQIGELRDFLSWLLECTPMKNEAERWLDCLDRGLPLMLDLESWQTRDILHVIGQQVDVFVQFSFVRANGYSGMIAT